MKNLTLAFVVLFALVGVFHTVNAQAGSKVRVEPDTLSAPVFLEEAGDPAIADKKKKKKKKKDGEESEEDYRSPSAGEAALELVDPGAFNLAARMEAAARLRD